jgi:hypothetical protein
VGSGGLFFDVKRIFKMKSETKVQHTPEVLEARGSHLYDQHGNQICQIYGGYGKEEFKSETARRMAFMWNACKGLSIELLEADGVTEMKTLLKEALEVADSDPHYENYTAYLERVATFLSKLEAQ